MRCLRIIGKAILVSSTTYFFEKEPKDHLTPEDCEHNMCGPPVMNQLMINILINLGVDLEEIMLADFGV